MNIPFFRRPPEEAEKHFKEALRCRNRNRKDFDLGLAIWHFKQAIGLKPNNPLFHCHLGQAYVASPLLAITRRINAGFRLRDSASLAIAELKEAIRLKPDYSEAYMALGEAYMYLGEKEKALRAFQAVIDLPVSQRLRVYAERETRQLEEGISKQPRPDEAKKHLEQAVAYRDQDKRRLAQKELDKALKLAPDWHWLYDSLCKVG
jgi:tetratricopeptide (TPR) repeat protein